LVAYVETDDYNWLNFNLGREEKMGLFINGAKAACNFLRGFDWEKYKAFRKSNLERDGLDMLVTA